MQLEPSRLVPSDYTVPSTEQSLLVTWLLFNAFKVEMFAKIEY